MDVDQLPLGAGRRTEGPLGEGQDSLLESQRLSGGF